VNRFNNITIADGEERFSHQAIFPIEKGQSVHAASFHVHKFHGRAHRFHILPIQSSATRLTSSAMTCRWSDPVSLSTHSANATQPGFLCDVGLRYALYSGIVPLCVYPKNLVAFDF
jgi:hypothetical protein